MGLPLIQDLQHTYDNVANLTRWQDIGASEDFTYEYDDLDRLTKKKKTGGADVETFGYNEIGNITSKNGLGYTYGTPLRVHAVTSYNGVGYGYDSNGNMISAGGWAYSYDKENRMAKAALSGALKARFAYDGDGKRGKRVDDYGTIHYVGPHYERNVGTGRVIVDDVTKYYYGAKGMSRPIALWRGGALYYVCPDHPGSTLRIVGTQGSTQDDILRQHSLGRDQHADGQAVYGADAGRELLLDYRTIIWYTCSTREVSTMARELKRIKLPPESDLALLLKASTLSRKRLIVDTGEALYSVSVDTLDEMPKIPKAEDVARSKEGILKAAGRWKEIVDAEAFKAYIHERRRTSGRPSVRL
ncbi:MAG: hypothetical protein HY675_19235 [Chloroflexi bacterium]|nr:hypothetical protein [Chloroflexota bacterium]